MDPLAVIEEFDVVEQVIFDFAQVLVMSQMDPCLVNFFQNPNIADNMVFDLPGTKKDPLPNPVK